MAPVRLCGADIGGIGEPYGTGLERGLDVYLRSSYHVHPPKARKGSSKGESR
jgi:hypothetical protein